jgi:hypothetical protein
MSYSNVRKLSENTLEELTGNHPLLWKRGFCRTTLVLKNLKIIEIESSYSVQCDTLEDGDDSINSRVDRDESMESRIEGTVDSSQFNAWLYHYKELDEKDEFEITSIDMPLKCDLSGISKKVEEDEKFPYLWGNAFSLDFGPEKESFCFGLCVPIARVKSLAERLRNDPTIEVSINIAILAFEHRGDTRGREAWARKHLLLDDSAQCIVEDICVKNALPSMLGLEHTHDCEEIPISATDNKNLDTNEEEIEVEMTPFQKSPITDASVAMNSISSSLEGLKLIAWLIFGTAVISLFN